MVQKLIDIALHLDKHLNEYAAQMGNWTYAILFAIIFAETGFVVTPFLPGDSLLFAVGSLCGTPGAAMNLPTVIALMCVAAILGDAVNYSIGKRLGPKVFTREDSRLLNKKHLLRAQEFYEKYGAKTIIIARFVPIVRTFAPFVAGVGRMNYAKFAFYNIIGGVFWVVSLTVAGYFFGRIEWVQDHFSIITVAIIVISVLPLGVELLLAWVRRKRANG